MSSDDTKTESAEERVNRNWDELLQELRVTQTGVQLLAGFMLTLPFQQRFSMLDTVQETVYLTTVSLAVLATAFIVGPVSQHRAVFRRHEKERLVKVGHRSAMAGLSCLALAFCGATWLVFDVVAGRTASTIAAPLAIATFASLWLVLPGYSRRLN